jgi:hypothetical protein
VTQPAPADHQADKWLERGRPGVLGVYLAYMIVRQVDFSIRHHGAAAVDQWLTYARGLVETMETSCR